MAGPGPVADKVMRDLVHVPDAVLTAVGSRSAERAAAFAAAHAALAGHGQVPAAHGSYRALAGDPNVDVVYIATPHPQHRALALAALAAGKSSHSGGSGGDCVEVADAASTVVVRDTKDRDAGTLALTVGAWAAFTASLKH